jgi:type IV pilus assembly protein PilZ
MIMNGRGVGDSERPNGVEVDEVDPCDRRSSERVDVLWSVDCETEDTFLYAAITNISEMGIFVRTTEPLAVGTAVTLRFAPPSTMGETPNPPPEAFVLGGTVQWVNALRPRQSNPNPGMGIRFSTLTLADRERIVAAIRTIAYLREDPVVRLPGSEPPSGRDSGSN